LFKFFLYSTLWYNLFHSKKREKIRKFSVAAATRDSEADSGPETPTLGGQIGGGDRRSSSNQVLPPVSFHPSTPLFLFLFSFSL
jgi:hypothetical protein